MKFTVKDEKIIQALKEAEKFIDLGADVLVEAESVKKSGWKLVREGRRARIEYSARHTFFAALKELLLGTKSAEKTPAVEKSGVMIDCARNAAMNLSSIKRYIVYLALLGFNYLELYVEDCMKVDDEECFGYMRGAYDKNEIREIDAFAQLFGIELIPCIQTLAHYNQLFAHPEYAEIRDKEDTLLIGEKKTYELIENILKTVSESFSSRNINIGMDEAHNAGRGRYYDKYGWVNKYDLLVEHLNKVIALCEKYGFRPSMWSDMVFKAAFGGQYYVSAEKFPEGFAESLPENIRLIYWDYYHQNREDYENMLRLHGELGREIVFAGGIWTWRGFTPYNEYTELTMRPALEAALDYGVKDVMMAMWGDNGGECSRFSVLSSLVFVSETLAEKTADLGRVSEITKLLTGYTREEFMKLDLPNNLSGNKVEINVNPSKYLLFSDPFLSFFDGFIKDDFEEKYARYAAELETLAERESDFSLVFAVQAALCRVLANKAQLSVRLKRAYDAKDLSELKRLAGKTEDIIADVKAFYEVFREQWNRENKSFGFEVQDIRLGGLMLRLEHIRNIVRDYAEGKTAKIEALEEDRHTIGVHKHKSEVSIMFNNYRGTVTAGIL